MYKHLLNLMENDKDKVTFYSRMENLHELLLENNLYEEIYKPQISEPVSFVWAITMPQPEIFIQQLGSMIQVPEIFQSHDQFIFVVDKYREADVRETIKILQDSNLDVKLVVIDRKYPGDRPILNWDIGINYAKYDRVFCVRDLVLPFNPWEMVSYVREVDISNSLINMGVVLGTVWSRLQDQWLFLLHPDFAPNPYLFAFVASKKNILNIGGFDRKFSRGFDHSGELDFLLRWNMGGFDYNISGDVLALHPGLAPANLPVEEMKFQSSIQRRYFFDRYGEEFIAKLQPPYNMENPLIEVNHALTYTPLTAQPIKAQTFFPEQIKDPFTFAKIKDSHYIVAEE